MDDAVSVLILINLLAGFGCAIPLARLLRKLDGSQKGAFRYFAGLIGLYLVESVAVAVGMGIPVFSVALAFVWGVVFGLWLRARASPRDVLKTSLWLSLYSSLPAASFVAVPVMVWIGGGHILSPAEGTRFGIPQFPHVLWPLNTIVGFYGALVAGAIVFKTVITTGEVSLLIHLREKPPVDGPLNSSAAEHPQEN